MDEKHLSELIMQKIKQWHDSQQGQHDEYEYEKTFNETMQSVGKDILQESMGAVPKNRKSKKKLMTSFGEIEAPHQHCITQTGGTFRMSSYCQEVVCYVGQDKVFEAGSETLEKLRGIEISAKQIERICHYYGETLEKQQEQSIEKGEEKKYEEEKGQKAHYAMVDGSMLLTREEQWKEVKLGRIFNAEDNVAIQENRNMITTSTYVAHVGGHKEFKKKMEYYLDALPLLIFVADGAGWIWN